MTGTFFICGFLTYPDEDYNTIIGYMRKHHNYNTGQGKTIHRKDLYKTFTKIKHEKIDQILESESAPRQVDNRPLLQLSPNTFKVNPRYNEI